MKLPPKLESGAPGSLLGIWHEKHDRAGHLWLYRYARYFVAINRAYGQVYQPATPKHKLP